MKNNQPTKKALVLNFSWNNFDRDELDEMKPMERLKLADENIELGIADVYTLDDFLTDINDGFDSVGQWYVYPCYVDEQEYKKYSK